MTYLSPFKGPVGFPGDPGPPGEVGPRVSTHHMFIWPGFVFGMATFKIFLL